MPGIKLICVGKLKERYYIDASNEYIKRLSPLCKINVVELSEARLPQSYSAAERSASLKEEARHIKKHIENELFVVAMCIEGNEVTSESFAELIKLRFDSGSPNICFVVGGSQGLHDEIKASADLLMSMSRMTLPHHLARVVLLEQLYRAFMINMGKKYHK